MAKKTTKPTVTKSQIAKEHAAKTGTPVVDLALAVVDTDAINRTVVPKPTKSEVIDALTEIRLKQIEEEETAKEVAKEAAEEAAKQAILKHLRRNAKEILSSPKLTISVADHDGWSSTVTIRFQSGENFENNTLDDDEVELGHEAHAAVDHYQQLPNARQTYGVYAIEQLKKNVRKEIAAQFDGRIGGKAARVASLLGNPESKAALEALLVSISDNGKKTIDIV